MQMYFIKTLQKADFGGCWNIIMQSHEKENLQMEDCELFF